MIPLAPYSARPEIGLEPGVDTTYTGWEVAP